MAKTIGVHEMAFESFQRLMENMHVRQQAYAFPTWKLSAGRVLEFLVWYFEESSQQGCEKCSPLAMKFQPVVGIGGRPKLDELGRKDVLNDPRVWPFKYSLACKMILSEKGAGYTPTHSEVLDYMRENPDIGMRKSGAV
jgi:hypothetical protein